MMDISEAYTYLGSRKCEYTIKTTTLRTANVLTSSSRTINVQIPFGFHEYSYLIASKENGILSQASVKSQKKDPAGNEIVVDLNENDTMVFIYIKSASPVREELTAFVDLNEPLQGDVTHDVSKSKSS